jgi:prepilin signal peptidase PulO-like enzyme (type II secretory pathway)
MLGANAKAQLKKRVKSFGQLVTRKMISEMKEKRVSLKLPVYRQGIPFALPIFIGTMITVLLGNPLLLAIH